MLVSYMKSIDVTGNEEPTPLKDFKKVIMTGATCFEVAGNPIMGNNHGIAETMKVYHRRHPKSA